MLGACVTGHTVRYQAQFWNSWVSHFKAYFPDIVSGYEPLVTTAAAPMVTLSPSLHQSVGSFGSAAGFMDAVRPILPSLRAYGRRLTGNLPDTDDLVQDTLARAWGARGRFEAGTNLKAWMMRIERNSFLNGRRRAARQIELDPEVLDRTLSEPAAQEERLHLGDLDRAVHALPAVQREAFEAVSSGIRYDDLAQKLGVPEGTLKSRVSRARSAILDSIDKGIRPQELYLVPTAGQADTTSLYEAWKRSGSRTIG